MSEYNNWQPINMKAFIDAVRMQPCLWNPLHPDYRELHVKDMAWQRVVDICNHGHIPNIHTAKLEWKKLRDNHRDALKRAKLGRNKLLPAQITTWKFAKAMQFLEPHMKYRITEHIELDPVSISQQQLDSKISDGVSTSGVDDSERYECSNPKRRCIPQPSIDPQPKVEHDTDALECFFSCILKTTRELPPWMQTQVKKKIFNVLIEAEESLSSQHHYSGVPGNQNQIGDSGQCNDDNDDELRELQSAVKCEYSSDDS